MMLKEFIIKKFGNLFYTGNKSDWLKRCRYESLSEKFIRKFKNKVDWELISKYQKLSEDFIKEFQDKVKWLYISLNQKLSEDFIREVQGYINWNAISCYQILSEDFIREFKNKVNWELISKYQKLSENFIREFADKVDWWNISEYQKLSEIFIREFQNKVKWLYISLNQKLSDDFIEEFRDKINIELVKDNWIYKSTKYKKQALIDTGKYECYDSYFIAYKAIRPDRYSLYNFQYQYLPNEEYESWCDCSKDENSFGLSVGTYDYCKEYLSDNKGMIVKCQVKYEDIGRIVHDGDKVRCLKIKILD